MQRSWTPVDKSGDLWPTPIIGRGARGKTPAAPLAFPNTTARGTARDKRTVVAHMAERGRQPGFRMNPEHRVKIQNSNVLNALIEHVEGKREMSATQVSAGVALLKKVLPDLTHNQHEGADGGPLQIVIQRFAAD